VIMPDHIHLFVAGDHEFDLGMWVRGLKRFHHWENHSPFGNTDFLIT